MNKHYVAYDTGGKIVLSLTCQPEAADMIIKNNGFSVYIEVPFPATTAEYYVHNGALTSRPASSVVLAGNVLNGAPAGASVSIDGVLYTADGTPITLNFAYAGSYTITVKKWPIKDWTGVYKKL